tara:strand:+ start:2571 stop:2780 length:210 start_codon:yes stop_codon:yes gene_type:complete
MTFYTVTADHVHPDHACVDRPVKIGGQDGRYYAEIAGYGCSRDYATPKDAIFAMLANHACTNIRVDEID